MGCTKIIYDLLPEKLFMGYGEEQLSRTLTFDISQMQAELPGGVPMIAYMRPRDELGYLASGVTLEGSTLTWELSAHVMQYKGIGGAQIVLVDESGEETHILKSHVMQMLIGSSIPLTGGEPPEPWETWLEQILAAAARAESAAADAEAQADRAETAEAGAQQALIDAGSPVLYGRAQTLTDVQQQTARGNIAAASAADVSDLKSALDTSYNLYEKIINGSVTGTGGFAANNNRLRMEDVLPVKAGDVVYVDSAGLIYGFEIWRGTLTSANRKRSDQLYCQPGTEYVRFIEDGFFCLMFKRIDGTAISPSDFTGEIRLYSHELRNHEEQIEALHSFLTPIHPQDIVYDSYYSATIGEQYTVKSSANFNAKLFPIEGGKKYRLETIGRTVTSVYFSWLDSNGIALRADGKAPAKTGDLISETYTAPSEAAFVTVNATKNTPVGGQTQQYIKAFELIADDIQGYYANELEATIKSVRDSITEPALVFPIVTDIHYLSVNDTFDNFIQNIHEFCKHVNCDFLLNLGDNTDGNTEQDITLKRSFYMLSRFNEIDLPYYMAIGNHDTNYSQGAPIFSSEQIFKAYLSNTRGITYDLTAGEKNYYVDFPELKIRLIVLDANHGVQYAFSARTATWLATEALQTDSIVVAAMHLSPNGNQNWNAQVPDHGQEVAAAFQAFVDGGGTLIQLCGHSHADYYFDSPWLTIYNGCQKFNQADVTTEGYTRITGAASPIVSPARTLKTATEDLWTVCVIKPLSRTIDMIRFGAGDDRSFNF